MRKALYILLIGFFAYGVFTSPDLESSDRDNAVIISARALIQGENPYLKTTEIGQKITTGIGNAVISIPFVYLFGNIQALSFLFYFLFISIAYRSRYFYMAAILIIVSIPFLYRVMYYRLDELYWVVFYGLGLLHFKSRWKYLLIIPIILSRNIFNFNFHILLYNIDYWILILLINNIILFRMFAAYINRFTSENL